MMSASRSMRYTDTSFVNTHHHDKRLCPLLLQDPTVTLSRAQSRISMTYPICCCRLPSSSGPATSSSGGLYERTCRRWGWRSGAGPARSASLLFSAWPHLRKDWPAIRKHWPIVVLLAALGIGAFNTLIYTGLQWTTAINALLLQSLMPVLIVLFSFLLFRDRITWIQAIGIAISVTGAFIIIMQGNIEMLCSLSLNKGDLIVFVAVLSYAGYSTLLRKRPSMHPLSFLAVIFFLGALMNLPFYVWESAAGRPVVVNRAMLLAVGYVMIFPSVVSYFCYNRGVDLIGANRAGLFIHLLPVFGSIMAVLLLGERFQWYQAVGIVFIAVGIFLATRTRSSR